MKKTGQQKLLECFLVGWQMSQPLPMHETFCHRSELMRA
jgi:hypothetical protein